MRHATPIHALGALCGALLVACGGGASSGAFSPNFPDNRAADVEGVIARIGAAPASASPTAGVGLSDTGALFAFDLASGQQRWSVPTASALSAPYLAGQLVALHEQSGVVVRGVNDGRTRFTLQDSAMHLVGAAGDGALSVFVLSTGSGVGARSEVILATSGAITWRREYEQAIGAPGLVAGLLILPWATQNVSVLEAATGDELARLRSTDAVVSEVLHLGGEVFYGRTGFFRLDADAATGSRAQAHYASPSVGELPGNPGFDPDPYAPTPGPTSAVHKIRLTFAPTQDGQGIADQTAYYVFYRLAFGLASDDGAVRWVASLPADALDSVAVPGGLWLTLADGSTRFFDAATGREGASVEVGHAATAARLPRDLAAPSSTAGAEPLPLTQQLLAAAQNTDARLVPARTLAIQRLGALEAEDATEGLIALCDEQHLPPPVHAAACQALGARTNGADFILTALRRHANFLEQTSAPPVGPLARAAAAMELTGAVPSLLGQLRDPETRAADLADLARALGALGDRAAAEPLLDFVRLYHADAPDEATRSGLAAAAVAVTTLIGAASQEELTAIASDPLCQPDVADAIREALAGLHEEPADETAAAASTEEAPAEQAGEDAESVERAPQLPTRITDPMITRALSPVEHELLACLSADAAHPASARLVLVLEGDGSVRMVSTMPHSLQGCIEPLVRAQTFPGNRAGRRVQLTHTIRRPR